MAYPSLPPRHAWILLLLVSSAVTFVLVAVAILAMPPSKAWLTEPRPEPATNEGAALWPRSGVLLVLRDTDGREIVRALPTASFSFAEGEPFDLSLPLSVTEAELRIAPRAGRVRDARLGVQFSGGQVVMRLGDRVILADAAGEEVREAFSDLAINLRSPAPPISITFRRRGTGPALLRTLWQPEGSLFAMRLPSDGQSLGSDASVRGHALMSELRCTACHAPSSLDAADMLAALPAGPLAGVADRVRAPWLAAFVHSGGIPGEDLPVRCGIGAAGLTQPARSDLLHYLSSLAGAEISDAHTLVSAAWNQAEAVDLIEEGAHLFHTAGCAACHGPLEPAERFVGAAATGTPSPERYAPMGDLSAKYALPQLAAYLLDPLAAHPDGRMPSLALAPREAAAIAAYLLQSESVVLRTDVSRPSFDVQAAARGAAIAASASCFACHRGGAHEDDALNAARRMAASAASEAPSLEAIAAAGMRGCLSEAPAAPAFDAGLSHWQREDLRDRLAELLQVPGGSAAAWTVPAHDRLAADMLRLRCTACHAYHADRGPEAALLAYFTSREDADLGDEGRLPPPLTDAGGRLTTAWMHESLSGRGRARPWLATRMPIYGDENVAHLPAAFAAAAGASALLDRAPQPTATAVPDGLQLVGVRGLNCIECHGVSGQPSVGMPGLDLTQMPERLLYSAFEQWLADPSLLRPGTRMPSFFTVLGSPITEVCGGSTECQIESMWTYLSLGALAPLPEGFPDPEGFDVAVTNEPVTFRSFMRDAGFRAIAIGFPEGVHAAYDADRGAITAVWRGRFLSARGAWGGRGGMLTDPDLTEWALPADAAMIALLDDAGQIVPAASVEHMFHGYRLDAQRVPEFSSSLRAGERSVRISMRAQPMRERGGPLRLAVRVRIEGEPGTRLRVQAPGAAVSVPPPGDIVIDERGSATILLEIPG